MGSLRGDQIDARGVPIELVPVRGSSVISHVSQPRSTRASLEVAYADLPPRRGNVEDVSTYRFLRRGAHLELFTELALSIRKVAGASRPSWTSGSSATSSSHVPSLRRRRRGDGTGPILTVGKTGRSRRLDRRSADL